VFSKTNFFLLSASLVLAAHGDAAENLGQYVVVVANKNAPDSLHIARYYAARRGVPEKQILTLDCPATEQVSRADFVRAIESPIRSFLETQGLLVREPVVTQGDANTARSGLVTVKNKIRYIVLCYGVPLKVAADPGMVEPNAQKWAAQFRRNEAAVDSELAFLPIEFPKTGVIPNPLYGFPNPTFTEPMNHRLILVTRLDGPTADDAKALVDRALEGERLGLVGRAYFDSRGLKSGGYLLGDEWIRKSYELAKRAGFECVLDEHGEIFDIGYPMTDCVLYAGWYTGSISGAPARKDFRFRPGAVAYHLHSDSAGTIRSETTCWVGPLVARGAACTMGCVYEPYLPGSPDIAIFFDRLLQGFNFAESAYASQQWLSWQTTFVGDPLYRPFAISVDEQIAALEQAKRPDAVFAHLRRINLMLNQEKREGALAYAREINQRLQSPVLTEKVGDMILDSGATVDAIQEYRDAERSTRDDWQAIRLHYKIADAYQTLGKDKLALQSLESILNRWPNYEGKLSLYLRMIPLAAKVGPAGKVTAWKTDALRLNPSLTNNPAFK
jgi:uncharacterized protein (TIGR03790 family)